MTTAYIIHNSEGVPVRRIVTTYKDAPGEGLEDLLMVQVESFDNPEWKKADYPNHKVSSTYSLGTYYTITEKEHHLFMRNEMRKQYGDRFEIYYPLSTIFS